LAETVAGHYVENLTLRQAQGEVLLRGLILRLSKDEAPHSPHFGVNFIATPFMQ
jgi:hypothetical protein